MGVFAEPRVQPLSGQDLEKTAADDALRAHADEDPVGSPATSPLSPARNARYPSIFHSVLANETTLARDVAAMVRRTVDKNGAAEVILGRGASRQKFLFALAQVGMYETVSAQIAPRRRDLRARALVTKGVFVSGADSVQVMPVGAQTDPNKLAGAMRVVLLDKNNTEQRKDVQLQCRGSEAAAKAMFALETLRFMLWQDVRFTASIAEEDPDPTVPKQIIIDIGICGSPLREEEGDTLDGEPDSENPKGAGHEAMPEVRLKRPLNPEIFPTAILARETSPMSLGKHLAGTLSISTTKAVEVLLADKTARGKLLTMLAALPPWVEAAVQVAPRRADMRSRFRILKDYPLKAKPDLETNVLKVTSSTEHEKLAKALTAVLVRGGDGKEAVDMALMGPEAATKAVLALESFQAMSKREVTFWSRLEAVKADVDGVQGRRVVVTVAAT